MHYRLRTLLSIASFAAIILFGDGTNTIAAEAAAARMDVDGDALPPAARFRVGTRLWRHRQEGHSLDWSPDGKRLAFINDHSEVRIVDDATGKLVLSFFPKEDGADIRPNGLAFSPNGLELAVRSAGRILLFDPATGKQLRTFDLKFEGFGDGHGNVVYSANGRYLALAEGPNYAALNRETGEVGLQEETKADIQGIRFSPDSNKLIVASLKPSLKIWDIAKREIVAGWTESETNFVYGPAIAPDGITMAVGQQDVIVVDPFTANVKQRLRGDDPRDLFLQLAFTPDGRWLLAASQEGAVYVWSVTDWSRKWKLTSNAWVTRSMAIRPDGKRVALGDASNRIKVWSLESGEQLFNDGPGHDSEVHAITFTPDGRTLITGGGFRCTHLWDAANGQHLRSLNASSNSLAVAEDGTRLLTSWYGAALLRTWDLNNGKQIGEWTSPEGSIHGFSLAANPSQLAVLLNVEAPRGFRLLRLTLPSLAANGDIKSGGYTRGCPAVSSDASLAAVGASSGVQLWDLAEGKVIAELPDPEHFSDALLFSRDGRFVIGTSSDQLVKMWEVGSCQLAQTLVGHRRVPAAITLSPNGRVLASAGGSKSLPISVAEPQQIRLWDIASGQQIASLSGHNEDVCSLAFSPDGKLLGSGMRDTTALVWELPENAQRPRLPHEPLEEGVAAELWDELGTEDAHRGQAAILKLAKDPVTALKLATTRMHPHFPLPDDEFQRLIKKLDADAFDDRVAALGQLADQGSAIVQRVQAVIKQTESSELRLRCGELLQLVRRKYPLSGQRLAETREVQLLELVGDERAISLLQDLAAGVIEAHLTRESKAALARLVVGPSGKGQW